MNKNRFLSKLLLLSFLVTANLHAQQWVSLFNGKNLTGWQQAAGTAKYAVQDGMIVGETVVGSPNSFLRTEKEYDNFVLELDAKLPDSTSNSGIQLRSHVNTDGRVYGYQYELDPSSRKWTGGLYDEARRDWLYPLSLNPEAQKAYLPGQFNHIKIECIGHEIKTWINGVPAAYVVDTMDAKGFIALQVHSIGNNTALSGEKVYFKNIRIKTGNLHPTPFHKPVYVVNNIPNYLCNEEKNWGWTLLFNGKNSDGWRGAYKDHFPKTDWQIKDGMITVLSSQGKEGGNGGDVVTLGQYSAFDLSFDFKLTPGANSGVKYFVTLTEHNEGSAIGLEYQVLDDALHPDAKLGRDGDRTLASLYDIIPAQKQARFVHPIGSWNTGRIVVYPNNHVEHYLNGIKVLEYDRGSPAFRALVAISKFKIWKNFGEAKQGHILLQDHGNEVSYRSIKIKPLQ
ncbi:MAG: DUF1080 domain-containing protein [Hydrotalea flava]|nr:DUF1080 domain-containing protein [Hydrotalea flava]NIM37459.1 DUF1080 domain-containing protein [Hydrotalea flava]NIN02627.1 DUF1080 domain-containing protein [Hydrotalea flava]NIN14298.1 DUF1080 domain-containing protein [Hydrotalea flava]NIO93385.1 DUF1080 domain-containing protein [Hydrotalea flava]